MLLTEHLVERTALAPFSARDISYIPRLNIVFAFISKNASSFLKAYLANLHRGRKFSQPTRNPHMPGNNGFQGVEQLGHRRMSEILNDPSVPKVVVGRHPVNRLVSAYLTRVVTWQRESYDSWNRSEWFVLRQLVAGLNHFSHAAPTINALQSDISWQDLIDFVCTAPSVDLDRHLVPQTYFAATDLIDYDLVGTVENLDEFLLELSALVGIPPLGGLETKVNVSRTPTHVTPVIAGKDIARISKRYRADFDYFGYEVTP